MKLKIKSFITGMMIVLLSLSLVNKVIECSNSKTNNNHNNISYDYPREVFSMQALIIGETVNQYKISPINNKMVGCVENRNNYLYINKDIENNYDEKFQIMDTIYIGCGKDFTIISNSEYIFKDERLIDTLESVYSSSHSLSNSIEIKL